MSVIGFKGGARCLACAAYGTSQEGKRGMFQLLFNYLIYCYYHYFTKKRGNR